MTDRPWARAGAKRRWRWRRTWPVVLVTAVLAVSVAGVLAQSGGNAAALDPDGVGGQGSRAVAVLLGDRGVSVQRVGTVEAARTAARSAGGSVTVFLPLPATVPTTQLSRLAGIAGASLVVIAPDPTALHVLAPEILPGGVAPVRERAPQCAVPAAVAAGGADLGGDTYRLQAGSAAGAAGCYPAAGRASLVTGVGPARRVTVLGTARPFTNDALGRRGNAALALGLLGAGRRVVWLRPRAGEGADAGEAASGRQGLVALLPDRLLLALAQGAVAVVLLALWRARRLGPVVAEQLPVTVRSMETTEGRARLYRTSSARASAASALREGTRRRLRRRLGLAPDAPPSALLDVVVERTPHSAGEVAALLCGDAPVSEAALVRLADEVDALAEEVLSGVVKT